MPRYRVKGNRDGTFEECTNLLGDYPMPFREIDGAPSSIKGKYVIPASRRPLVHVFMVQESMPIDGLKCTIKSIRDAVKDMHPDMKIVLLSYSNRIGVHLLGKREARCGGSTRGKLCPVGGRRRARVPIHGNSSALNADREGKCHSIVSAMCPVGFKTDFLNTAESVGGSGLREDLDRALDGIVAAFHRTAEIGMPVSVNGSGLSVSPEELLGSVS